MKSRKILLVLLAVIAAVGAWQLSTKKDLLKPELISSAWQDLTGDGSAPAPVAAATSAVQEIAEEVAGPPVADPVPDIPAASAGEMYPFPADAPLLSTTVTLPEKKAPLVYVAYCGNSSETFTSASLCFGEFYKYQLQQQGTAGLMMNALPNSKLLMYSRRSFADNNQQVPFETYLKDAQELNVDLLLYPVFDGSSSQPLVTVKMVDLNTSRSETWSSQQAGLTSVNKIIATAAAEALRFAGYSDEEIQKANLQKGAPSDTTFAWYASTAQEDMTYENLLQIAEADPEFVYVYSQDGGTTWIGQLIDRGVHKFPDDPRLLTRKATALYDAGSTVALVRYVSELIRRYPENCFTYYGLADRLNKAFVCGGNAKETPPVFRTMVEQLGLMSEHYSDCYSYAWDHAYALISLGRYIRGTHTVDKIPDHIWPERQQYIYHAYHIMDELVEKHPTHVSLLAASSFFDDDVRRIDIDEQRELIKRVAQLDPRETEVEISSAQDHSIGYGSEKDYFSIIDRAFKSHAGDPQATAEIASAVRQELHRQVGWKQMTMDEALTVSNPWLNRFVDAADFVYSTGRNIDFNSDWTYYLIMEKRGNQEKIKEWRESGQNSYVAAKVASEAYEGTDWETCQKYAKLALPHMYNDDKGHHMRYYLIKSLWKLKRYEESLKEAREGIFKYPQEQTFPYMYAVVALEAGTHLETAYDCAWRAVDLGTDNQGCNDTFEKLRAKLNKPPHPALVALGK